MKAVKDLTESEAKAELEQARNTLSKINQTIEVVGRRRFRMELGSERRAEAAFVYRLGTKVLHPR